jgi:hypothetical protein
MTTTPSSGDWLDALAVRSATGRPRALSAGTPEAGSPPSRDDRFSRATAFKLALTGAASISLGFWKASPALAQDRGTCFTQCLTDHDKELRRRLAACDDVFYPRTFEKTAPSSWKRLRAGLFGGERDLAFVAISLDGFCSGKATWDVRQDKKDCYDRCETTCRRRSMQWSSSSSAATCEVTPPHQAPPPTVPPIPHPTEGVAAECANCAAVGGACCSGTDPTHLCACANPAIPCERYGCGA